MSQALKAWSHSLTAGQDYVTEHRLRRHDGSWRWYVSLPECQNMALRTLQSGGCIYPSISRNSLLIWVSILDDDKLTTED